MGGSEGRPGVRRQCLKTTESFLEEAGRDAECWRTQPPLSVPGLKMKKGYSGDGREVALRLRVFAAFLEVRHPCGVHGSHGP